MWCIRMNYGFSTWIISAIWRQVKDSDCFTLRHSPEAQAKLLLACLTGSGTRGPSENRVDCNKEDPKGLEKNMLPSPGTQWTWVVWKDKNISNLNLHTQKKTKKTQGKDIVSTVVLTTCSTEFTAKVLICPHQSIYYHIKLFIHNSLKQNHYFISGINLYSEDSIA